MQDGVVELAREPQRPEVLRPAAAWPRQKRAAALVGPWMVMVARRVARSISTLHAGIDDCIGVDLALDRRQRDAFGVARPVGLGSQLLGGLLHGLASNFEFGDGLVDEAPLHRARAAHALLHRAERVGQIAAHLALVGDAREPAGARQHRQQRQLGQRHGRVAVVGQQDVVGGERQLVAAAGGGAANGAHVLLAGGWRSRPPCRCASRW